MLPSNISDERTVALLAARLCDKAEFAHLLYAADKFISKAKYPEDADLNLDMEYEQLMKQLA